VGLPLKIEILQQPLLGYPESKGEYSPEEAGQPDGKSEGAKEFLYFLYHKYLAARDIQAEGGRNKP
jgi:hypothetical protein